MTNLHEVTEGAVNVNTDVMCSINNKWEMAAFHKALVQLKPASRVQVVVFDDKKLLDGARKLVEAGVFKPYGKSNCRFVVPKRVAFASVEPSLASIEEDV